MIAVASDISGPNSQPDISYIPHRGSSPRHQGEWREYNVFVALALLLESSGIRSAAIEHAATSSIALPHLPHFSQGISKPIPSELAIG